METMNSPKQNTANTPHLSADEVRKRYLEYFQKSPRNHTVIPSASLVPENDPTTLFTGSGMQPLLPYLLGEKHPEGVRLVDSQKCFRAEDIEEVGDNRHTTFFEMLGNWSLGDYWKEEQLEWFFRFLTEEVNISKDRLWITCFEGDKKLGIPPDSESAEIWKTLGIPEERICFYGSEKNWWSRSGIPENMPIGEPGGPDSEVFYEFVSVKHDTKFGEHCHPNCDCGRFMEIGNSVFMQYIKQKDGSFKELEQKNVDFGGGLERITAAANDNPDVFCVDSLRGIIKALEAHTKKSYGSPEHQTSFRIIADHMRAVIFMIGDGVLPSNTEQGYFVRRLIRRSMIKLRQLGSSNFALASLAHVVGESYAQPYPSLHEETKQAIKRLGRVVEGEEKKFGLTLEKGLKEFEKIATKNVSGHDAFVLFSTHGFPIEVTEELAVEKGLSVDRDAFDKELRQHQELSRKGAEQKFKGGLADSSEKVVQYHTATHLLLAGLRKELGEHVHQAGSNITGERLRFDFTHGEKVDREVLDKVEEFVNKAIAVRAKVTAETMKKDEAEKDPTIEGSFWERYPDEVKVYTISDDDGGIYSRELCGGPHVGNTGELGKFKIKKEEASSAGVRRIKATLE